MTASESIAKKLAGRFLVFDGPDGCGKTTQIEKLARHLDALGTTVVIASDPGGTAIGDRIRHILLGFDLREMDLRCETFLFMASRAQLVAEVIEPALADGHVVLCSRFITATIAYQGAGGYEIDRLLELANRAVGDTWPDLTIVLDLPVEVGFQRTGRKTHHVGANRTENQGNQEQLFKDANVDAMEARPTDFHRRVREKFLELPGLYPRPVHILDAGGSPDQVHEHVLELIQRVDF